MALVLADRVKDTTTTTGTGTVTLSGTPPTGFQAFSVIGDGNTTYYAIVGGSEWEVGVGTYTASGTTLARTTVLESSNSGSLVDFSAGTKDVFVTYPADKSIADGFGTLPVANGGTGATTLTSNNVILGNGTSAVQFVAPGTNGNVLTSNGTTWTSAANAKDFVLLQTVDITSSVTNIELTTSSTYNRYLILLNNIVTSTTLTGASTTLQFGTGSPVAYITSGYSYGLIRNGATTPVQANAASQSSGTIAQYQVTNSFGIYNMVVEIGGVNSGAVAHCVANTLSANGRDTILAGCSVSRGGSAVTGVKIAFGATATSGKAYLYGLSSS
jgi:hypothetical protein